ncbi:MAG TPA: CapA family protein [Steroidobacteraceae bacterium]|nr:CapA family protein [Steroidobacteraceae bacterium]
MRPMSRAGIPAGAALLALLALLAACAAQPPATTPAPPAPSRAAAPETPPIPKPTHPGLTLAAVGDMMLGTDFPENILPDDDGLSFLDAVTPILERPDLTFGNLEGVLQDGGEPVKVCKNKKICFLFRSPARYTTYFKLAGFDVLSLANNHARDFGEDGRSSSMWALDAAGIHHSGREGTAASFVVNGRRVAMVAFAPNVGSNSLNDPQIGLPLVAELAAKHDIVIVSFHGGAEGTGAEVLPFAREIFAGEDRGNVVEFARAMIDAGADIVLGHGPHVVRPLELYNDRLIAYSLGNFATYYGISVEGIRGIAPILLVTLDDEGKFVSGRIEPTIQVRPAGPAPDPARAVIALLRTLTEASFPGGALTITEDGTLVRRSPQ